MSRTTEEVRKGKNKRIVVKSGTVTSGNNFRIATSTGNRDVKSKAKNTGYLNVNSDGTGSSSATPGFNPNVGAKSVNNQQTFEPNASFEPESSPLSAGGASSISPSPNETASSFTPDGMISAAAPGEEITDMSKARFEAGETARSFAEGFTGEEFRQEQDQAKFHETLAFVAGALANFIPIPGAKGLEGMIKGANLADDAIKTTGKLAPVIKDKKLASQLVSTAKNDRLIKTLVNKYLRGLTNEIKTVVNPTTGRITETLITKKNKLIPLVTLALGIGASVSMYAWDGHLKLDNVAGGYQIALRDALKAGNQEGYEMINDAYNEYLDRNWFDGITSMIPGINVMKTTFIDGMKQAKTSKAAFDIMIEVEANTSNDTDYWLEVDRRKAEMERAQTDYWLETQRNNRMEAEAARVRGDRESMKMWAEHQKKMREAEIANAKLLSEIWLEHDRLKAAQQIETAYEPQFSNLNFGLI